MGEQVGNEQKKRPNGQEEEGGWEWLEPDACHQEPTGVIVSVDGARSQIT